VSVTECVFDSVRWRKKEIEMTTQFQFDAIKRVMNALRYSLASYLQFARPWIDANGESIADAIKCVAGHHSWHATRLGRLLMKRRANVVSRAFPATFTALNDVSVRHALPLVIEDSQRIVRHIEASLNTLRPDRDAYQLAMEICDGEKRHLSLLQNLHDAQQAERPAPQPYLDCVSVAGEHSFPASDAPSWTGAAATKGKSRPGTIELPVRVQAVRSRRMLSHS
jgi:hypothetical protein